ncbi:MAG: sugar phosphate nucleotidyltransferase [Candidatus Nanoarchaeia archaeon]|nr:sugar phosphate nucleotidyltransferase [Candidatus Nanoarchaeia archaeon]MDD5239277.1 sugar phosphate nucleotidyltransferase [Candidatus Nanoarchaeia archaeon]
MKERITITLDKDIMKQVDSRVDGTKIKNRSHAVEFFLSKALGSNTIKTAFILAGGKGTRLKPFTYEIPKPMIPVHGMPILQHVIELFKRYGINEIIISIGYKGDKIKEYFGDGIKFGVKIRYIEEDPDVPLGTAGPLLLAKEFLKETFVMTNADELKDIDLDDMYRLHKESKAMATIALTTVEDPSSYGVARLKGSQIVEFVEKPRREEAPSKLINAGLYILEPEILKYIPDGKKEVKIENDVFPKIAKMGKLFGYPFSGQWFDTGTPENYEKAIKRWQGLK